MKRKMTVVSFALFTLIVSFGIFSFLLYQSTTWSNYNMNEDFRKYEVFLAGPYDEDVPSQFIEKLLGGTDKLVGHSILFKHASSNSLSVISNDYPISLISNYPSQQNGEVYVSNGSIAAEFPTIYGIGEDQITGYFTPINNLSNDILFDYKLNLFSIQGEYFIASSDSDIFDYFESLVNETGNYTFTIDMENPNIIEIFKGNAGLTLMLIGLILSLFIYLITVFNFIKDQTYRTRIYTIFGASKRKNRMIITSDLLVSLLVGQLLTGVASYILFGNLLEVREFVIIFTVSLVMLQLLVYLFSYLVMIIMQFRRGEVT